jgi:VCBS repeat-containing protein
MFQVSKISSVNATLSSSQAKILVFIDSGVEAPQFLAQGIIAEATAFILDSAQDGIKQITEILQDYPQVESIHLVSHGSPGSIQLGNTYLSLDTIAEYQQDLKSWNVPSLLIYGCNVAAGDAGAELLDKLHQLTGANIAASTHKIGQDGWKLESEVGQISVELAFNNQTQNQYLGNFGLTWDADNTLPNNSPNITGQYGLGINTNFLYATDSVGNIDIYQINSATGGLTYNSSFGEISPGNNLFGFPLDIDFFTTSVGQTKAFVPDRNRKRVAVLDVNSSTGALAWDNTNTLPVESPNINGQLGLEVNGNFLYVTDYDGHNIDIYQINGATGGLTYQSSFGSEGSGTNQFNRPLDIDFFTTAGGQTKAFVPDELNHRLVVLDVNSSTGALNWDTANTLSVDSPNITSQEGLKVNGNLLYVTDYGGNNIDVYQINNTTGGLTYKSSFGSTGSGVDRFQEPNGIGFFTTSVGQTKAFVPDASNRRIVALDVTSDNVNVPPAAPIERVSVASDGTQGNNYSYYPSISGDGRYVTFNSNASNLVAGDTNDTFDVFVYDRQLDTTERVSVSSDGTQGNNYSYYPSISGNGRYVTFGSNASNLVPGDTNNSSDVFVYDRQLDTTERVSVSSDGTQGDSDFFDSSISGDGRYVTFASNASNLVAGDTNDTFDVFVHDRQLDTTERVSVSSDGTQGNEISSKPSISGDGRYVTFASNASNLVAGDTNDTFDVFVYDRQLDTTERLSVSSDGTQSNYGAGSASISGDGRYVTFQSFSSNLVAGDTNNVTDVFVVENPPLVAKADSNTTNEDNILTVAAPGVLSNDSGDGITVTTSDTTSAQGATVVVNPNGSYSYDPRAVEVIQALGAGGTLSDTFNYAIASSSGATASAQVTINLTGVNDAPLVATPIPNQIANNTNAFSLDVSSNFKDADASDQPNFSATGLPVGLSISPEGLISGQTQANGAYNVMRRCWIEV